MNKKGFIIEIIVGVVLIILGFFWFTTQYGLDNGLEENETLGDILEEYLEEECVKASCCHATKCVKASQAPNCSDVLCTMDCQPGTMDCGQGTCKLIDSECKVLWNA